MKTTLHSLTAARSLAVIALLTMCASTVQAASILTLSGETGEVKYESDANIRISVINWSEENQQQATEGAWRQYRDDQDAEAFLKKLETLDTRGYLFTASSTGYRIKYAWQEEKGGKQMMHFLVIPGLKTRNPYMWHTPNNQSPEFSLVQVEMDNETGIAKTSLDGNIIFNEAGRLMLENFDNLNLFATLEDSTPYYLK